MTIKALKRRMDGVFEPEGHDGPVFIAEFLGQPARAGGYNLLKKIGLFGEQNPDCDLVGVLVYLRESDCPRYPRLIGAPGSPVLGVAL